MLVTLIRLASLRRRLNHPIVRQYFSAPGVLVGSAGKSPSDSQTRYVKYHFFTLKRQSGPSLIAPGKRLLPPVKTCRRRLRWLVVFVEIAVTHHPFIGMARHSRDCVNGGVGVIGHMGDRRMPKLRNSR